MQAAWPLHLTPLGSASPSGSGWADSLPVSSPGAAREGGGACAGRGEAQSLGHREMISHWWKAADLSVCAQPQACPPPPPYVTQGLEGKVDLALILSTKPWPTASLFLIAHVHTPSPGSPYPQAPCSRTAPIYKTGLEKTNGSPILRGIIRGSSGIIQLRGSQPEKILPPGDI